MKEKRAVVLFSDDFRLHDNPALYWSYENNYQIIPLFIYQKDYIGRELGSASKVFLHFIVKSFSEHFKQNYNQNLIIKTGSVIENLKQIQQDHGFDVVLFNRSYTAKQISIENEISRAFNSLSFKAKLIFEPNEIRQFKVFTPFWKECLASSHLARKIVPRPSRLNCLDIPSLKCEDLKLLPKQNWHQKLLQYWEFDYTKLHGQVDQFFTTTILSYKDDRNFLSRNAVSKFSPYIRFGAVSVNDLFVRSLNKSASFNAEIGWREFAHHTLFYNQNLDSQEIKPEFQYFKWDDREDFLHKWQAGNTGESIVDAGMKELWETGFMHGRARMITASFLIKDLFINWKKGEQWFWDCLVDACPAVNPFSWQWVFGSGYDAAPYFRVFNPALQKERFDPNEAYTKLWNKNPKKLCIVEHSAQRKEALLRYKNIKEQIIL